MQCLTVIASSFEDGLAKSPNLLQPLPHSSLQADVFATGVDVDKAKTAPFILCGAMK